MKIKILYMALAFCFLYSYDNICLAQKRTYYCLNLQLDTLFSFDTHFVWPFTNNIAAFKTKIFDPLSNREVWRTGFIDNTGKIILPPIYDSKYTNYYGFKYEVSWVRNPNTKGFKLIDKKGKVLTNQLFEKVGTFNDSLCAVYINGAMGFVNVKGDLVIPCIYQGADSFSEGLACVKPLNEDSGYGFINKHGEIVIPFIYKQTAPSRFEDNMCVVIHNNNYVVINKSGEIICEFNKDYQIIDYGEGLFVAKIITNDQIKYGFLNLNNEWTIEPKYDNASNFINNRAIVKYNDKYGVIDKAGVEVIKTKYDIITGDCKNDNLFIAVEEGYKYFFNCNGFPFTKNLVKQIKPSNGSTLFPFKGMSDKMGFLNADGNYACKDIFQIAESFSEGLTWVY